MDAISYSAARANLAKTMDKVTEDHDAIIITRQKGNPVVMLSLEDYNSLTETAYLPSSPANAKLLLTSIEQAEKGLAKKRKLIRG
jgi:antitoxin YefM